MSRITSIAKSPLKPNTIDLVPRSTILLSKRSAITPATSPNATDEMLRVAMTSPR